MNISLTPELEQLVRSKIQSGGYRSEDEVVMEALRLMGEHDQLLALQREVLGREIEVGLDSLRDGPAVDGEAVFERLEAELDALERDGR